MDFEWDEEKRKDVIAKHGVDLLEAALIFEGIVFTAVDDRHEYGEVRMRSVGVADGRFFVVVHTQRGHVIRLISARRGGRRDRRKYQEGLAGGLAPDEGRR